MVNCLGQKDGPGFWQDTGNEEKMTKLLFKEKKKGGCPF